MDAAGRRQVSEPSGWVDAVLIGLTFIGVALLVLGLTAIRKRSQEDIRVSDETIRRLTAGRDREKRDDWRHSGGRTR